MASHTTSTRPSTTRVATTCALCGAAGRTDSPGWRAVLAPLMTSEVRFVCAAHVTEEASAQVVFADYLQHGRRVTCVRCGRVQPARETWPELFDDVDGSLGAVCPVDLTPDESAGLALVDHIGGPLADVPARLANAVTLHRLGLHVTGLSVGSARMWCYANEHGVEAVRSGMSVHHLMDWAVEAVGQMTLPERLHAQFLDLFYGWYVEWYGGANPGLTFDGLIEDLATAADLRTRWHALTAPSSEV